MWACGTGLGVETCRDETREVGHVHHEVGAHQVRDAAEFGEVQLAGVRGPAGDDQLRLALEGEAFNFCHVHGVGVLADAVGDNLVQLAREVDAHAVGQVSAVGEVQAHDGVARGDQRVHGRGVRLCAGVRLDVGELCTEQGLQAVNRQLLDHINVFAAAVVALARVAFGVLVGQHRSLGFHDGRWGGEVLGGDHFQRGLLADEFLGDRLIDLRVRLGERADQRFNHGVLLQKLV